MRHMASVILRMTLEVSSGCREVVRHEIPGETAILPTVIEQRASSRAVESLSDPHDPTQEDGVIAPGKGFLDPALDPSEAFREDGKTFFVPLMEAATPGSVGSAGGKVIRDRLLVLREDVDREISGGWKLLQTRQLRVQADQDQRRIE